MDYKKKYEEALEKGREFYNRLGNKQLKEEVESIFPELVMSEDERIRKNCIEYIKASCLDIDELNECIAWLEKQGNANKEYWRGYREGKQEVLDKYTELEKQGEKKPADKVEPKFHEGEWIVRELDNTCYQIKKCILNVTNNKYGYDLTSGGYISSQDANFYHLWTLQDAKDGDVLATDDWVFIFKELNAYGKPVCYCHYDDELGFKVDVNSYMTTGSEIHSATKEQRDLLFQKMHEAGYEWDAERKELRKIEQNPAWSEEDEKTLSNIIKDLVHPWNEYIPDRIEDEIKWLKNKLKSLRPQNWKPSNEQMDALAEALSLAKSCGDESAFDLRTLYEQLNKL